MNVNGDLNELKIHRNRALLLKGIVQNRESIINKQNRSKLHAKM